MSSPGAGLLQLTAELVDIPSVSHDEGGAAAFVAAALSGVDHLEITRIGHNVVACTALGRPQRLLIAGHLDTVPPNGNERAVIDGDRCSGLGAADMKGGIAVMLELARRVVEPTVDMTYVWYACEEVEQRYSGLIEIETVDPGLLAADAAVLAEPTSGVVEAGCQGVLRIAVCLGGERAHTARSWMGVNAIHRLGLLLELVDGFVERRPVLDGCEFREALQAVRIDGGVANNVVPDDVRLVLSHRYAPDRTKDQAFEALYELLAPAIDARLGDQVDLEDFSPAAAEAGSGARGQQLFEALPDGLELGAADPLPRAVGQEGVARAEVGCRHAPGAEKAHVRPAQLGPRGLGGGGDESRQQRVLEHRGRSQREVLEDDLVPEPFVQRRAQELTDRLERLVFRAIGGIAVTEHDTSPVRDDVVGHAAFHADCLQGLAVLTAAQHRPALVESPEAL